MNGKTTPLELLAPARDLPTAMAAIDCGADAVYIGGPGFGARAAAVNSMKDIEALARYAGQFHARTYLTLNTLLFDSELERARTMAWDAYRAGADALIIEDMGLLEMDLPPIEIHASTQCDIRTPEKARFLDDCGFSQLVLARELSLEEIAAVRAAVPRARLEFFVHGALCVSYSGQCYLSCAETGRSANRGECAQPCRLAYDVYDFMGREIVRGKHVLSLKDNDQSENLEALVRAGVTSFKIEGRLKDAAYVKNVTAYYREKLDALIQKMPGFAKASLGESSPGFVPDPEKTFHRSQTDYFVHGRQDDIAQLDTPKSTGSFFGTVCYVKKRPFTVVVRAKGTAANGDGLFYTDQAGRDLGFRVNRARGAGRGMVEIVPWGDAGALSALAPGAKLFRNYDYAFEKALAGSRPRRTMVVDFEAELKDGRLVLRASAEGASAESSAEGPFEKAPEGAPALSKMRAQCGKTGSTPFKMGRFSALFASEETPLVPLRQMNALRRGVLLALSRRIAAQKPGPVLLKACPCLLEGAPEDFRLNASNRLAVKFWKEHGAKNIQKAFEISQKGIDLRTAELMRCRHCVRRSLGLCPRTLKGDVRAKAAFKAANGGHLKPEPLVLVDSKGRKLLARFDCRRCEMTISLAAGASSRR